VRRKREEQQRDRQTFCTTASEAESSAEVALWRGNGFRQWNEKKEGRKKRRKKGRKEGALVE
jgi:hypothetical protein